MSMYLKKEMTVSKPIVVFDLDDTLYDELSYVRSGLRSVANFLAQKQNLDSEVILQQLVLQLNRSRTGIFDSVLEQFGCLSKSLVRQCVTCYRFHEPQISLWPSAQRCLERFKDVPKYIVTDGNKNVQKRKLIALGLYESPLIRFCYLTYRYGHHRKKPSPYCFFRIAEREKTHPRNILYVGDNPHKDFSGIRPEGFITLRVLTGQHRNVTVPVDQNAKYTIQNLDELTLSKLSEFHCN